MNVPDAKAKLDDARWNLDMAMTEMLRDVQSGRAGPSPFLVTYISNARRHICDLMTDSPFKDPKDPESPCTCLRHAHADEVIPEAPII